MEQKVDLHSEFQAEKPFLRLEEINEAPSDHENSGKDQSPSHLKDNENMAKMSQFEEDKNEESENSDDIKSPTSPFNLIMPLQVTSQQKMQ